MSDSLEQTYTDGVLAMNKYIIERNIPDAGKFTQEQLSGISQTSCCVLNELGPEIKWLESYVTGDKIYCVYLAESEDIIRQHARQGGFPADNISMVTAIINPSTATLA
ncbi:DUF4242 domain-containing protein [Shewanella corallii]|uniref:DUF4242 domain-containing protein n=1 Tax=Shewanella corallii TaxID=560080 RepID=A0ABT0N3D2_9GAMM|nr:DUF4242 domain-containing protein [Shewanella corallii]